MVRATRVEVRLLTVALALVALGFMQVGRAQVARAAPPIDSTTTTTQPTTTTTTKPTTTTTAKPTTTTSTSTTLPPTSVITTPTTAYQPPSSSTSAPASSSTASTQSVTTYTLPTSTVTAPAISNGGAKNPKPKGGSSGLSDGTKLWLVVGGLIAVGVVISVLTFLYWRRTRPGGLPATASVLSPAALDALAASGPQGPPTPPAGISAVGAAAMAKPASELNTLVPPQPKVAPPPGTVGPHSGVRILGPVAAGAAAATVSSADGSSGAVADPPVVPAEPSLAADPPAPDAGAVPVAEGVAVVAAASDGPTADPLTDSSQVIVRELWPTMAAPTVEPTRTAAPLAPVSPVGADGPGPTAAPVPVSAGGGRGDAPMKIVTLEELQQRAAEQAAASARADGADWTDGESPTGETPGAGDG